MKSKTLWLRGGGVLGLVLLASAPSTCDSGSQQQQDLQEELRRQNAARVQAEQTAHAAEQASNTNTITLGAGGCVLALVAGLVGIAIGSRARRSGKERDCG